MVAYSFAPRFAPLVAAGAKQQTIRAPRRRHAKPDELVQLYRGMRTPRCQLLGVGRCLQVHHVRLWLPARFSRDPLVVVRDGVKVQDIHAFAVADGFKDVGDMLDWWRGTHPQSDDFEGVLVRWKLEEQAA